MTTAKYFPTRNDLPVSTRKAIIDLINQQLVDMIDLHSQTKFAHWNVKGPYFIALHELFDKLADGLSSAIDDTAERAAALGGLALGTTRQTANTSRMADFPLDSFTGAAVVAALADRFAAVAKSTRATIEAASADADTVDLFTGISRELDKALWFLETHLVA